MTENEKKIAEEEIEETAERAAEETEAAEAAEREPAGEEPVEDGPAGTEEPDGEEPASKNPFFKRKKEKKDKKDEQIEVLQDRLKRNLAEFENFRKRTEKEKSQMYDMGVRSVAEKLLPVIDNFERGIAMRPEEETTAFAEGMDKVYKQFTDLLENLGVTPIEAVGQPFDPNFHNAVMQDTESDAESGTVVEEFQKGYMLRDTVIRYSMVKVKA
ncbi:MAG: nucleotide exchange factor GrpE [Lachnospiraceae bacterium]|nr:nucleotide exchange factor GrpE [Lachnospiraceae bacterium]